MQFELAIGCSLRFVWFCFLPRWSCTVAGRIWSVWGGSGDIERDVGGS